VPTPPPRPDTAIILTALDGETRAVLRHLPDWHEEVVEGTVFYCGRFEDWNIAVAEIGPGNPAAAAIGERAIRHFGPRVALFVGIAGGVKDVEIGDVVIATKVHGYESGKESAQGFEPRGDAFRTAHEIEQRARALDKRGRWRNRLDKNIDHAGAKLLVAPIAAGEKVVASSENTTARLLKKLYGDAVAVEMEGRGFLQAVYQNAPVQGGVIRGISDLLDGKSKAEKAGSQERAADIASAVAFEILASLDGGRGHLTVQAIKPFREKPSTFSKAAYFQRGEVLAKVEILFSFADGPHAYLRVIPTVAFPRPIPLATLNEIISNAPLLRASGLGGLSALNAHGVILYDPMRTHRGGPAELHLATQLFQNGELWCMSDLLIVRERGLRPDWVPVPFIPAFVLEKAFYETAHHAVSFAEWQLGLTSPIDLEFGLVNLQGVSLGFTEDDTTYTAMQMEDVVVRARLTSFESDAVNSALLEFFNEVFDRTGQKRPAGLHGFPPGPLTPTPSGSA
jgi:nucleoside phosphorylase